MAHAIEKERDLDIFKENGPTEKWWRGFRKRHPDITLRTAGSLDRGRAVMTNENVVREYFELLRSVIDENNLGDKPHQIYNC